MCEDVRALGIELENYTVRCLLLRVSVVGFTLWPVEGDLMAPSPAVVVEEAEDGVLFRVGCVVGRLASLVQSARSRGGGRKGQSLDCWRRLGPCVCSVGAWDPVGPGLLVALLLPLGGAPTLVGCRCPGPWGLRV